MDRALLRKELIRDEGEELEAYKDSLGYWTIGVGHLLGSTPRMTVITRAESRALLEADIDEAMRTAERWVPDIHKWDLDDLDGAVRQRAIINMAFNLGDKLGQFRNTLAALNAGNWEKAAEGMLASKWATQVGQRAVRLAHMVKTGETA